MLNLICFGIACMFVAWYGAILAFGRPLGRAYGSLAVVVFLLNLASAALNFLAVVEIGGF